jgi:serine protease Do
MNLFDKLKKEKLLSVSLLVFTLSVGILIGTLVNTSVRAEKGQTAADATPLTIPNPVQLSTAFSQLAKQLEPSVVNITSTYGGQPDKQQQQTRNRRRQQPVPDQEEDDQGGTQDFFRRFFGGNPFGDVPPQSPFRRQAMGSGFVVDKNGYILTNNHVVEDASRIQVKFTNDSREYNAKLVGADPESDLAVIKVQDAGRALVPAKVGNSDSVQVGDWAVAIGSPFGLEATVTAGIISATGRNIGGTEHQLQKFLQTDAAINPGNSGGPLLNIRGEVIGINTAIATESGGYQGIGFALPVNMAANVYNQIIKTGKVTRGSIGIQFRPDTDSALLKAYGATQGVFVQTVTPGGPADKAGIKAEDVILSFKGRPIKDGDDLVSKVSETPVGSQADLTVLRNGKKQDFTVTIADRSEVFADLLGGRRRSPSEKGGTESTQVQFGMNVRDLTGNDRDRFGFEGKGVLITAVDSGSFADDIGLAARDIISSVNRQPVTSVDDLKRIQATLKPGDAVAIKVMRAAPAAPGQGNQRGMQWQPFFAAGTLPANP